jgi:hypothetical protein
MASKASAITRAAYIAELGVLELRAGPAMMDRLLGEWQDDDAGRAPDCVAIEHVHDMLVGKKGADATKYGRNAVHFLEAPPRPGEDVLSLKPPVGEKLRASLSDEPGVMAWCTRCSRRHPLLAWEKCWVVPDGGEQGTWAFFYICTGSVKVCKVDLSVHFLP